MRTTHFKRVQNEQQKFGLNYAIIMKNSVIPKSHLVQTLQDLELQSTRRTT